MLPTALCVDFSADLGGGSLVAYRLEERTPVSAQDFVWVQ
jgi:hypothetical protein